MAIVSLTEAAELAWVSRGGRSTELSRSSDGIDTSELMRVFGPISRPQADTTVGHRASAVDTAEASIDVTAHAAGVQSVQLNTLLHSQLAAAERERSWLKSLVEEERAQVTAREQELARPRPRRGSMRARTTGVTNSPRCRCYCQRPCGASDFWGPFEGLSR